MQWSKRLLILIAVVIVFYVFTRPREHLCALTPVLTANSIRKACEEQRGVYDEATNTCSCPNGTV